MSIGILALAGVATAQDIRATVNGEVVSFPDAQPIMINSRVMVPVRGVFEYMNASVSWDEGNRAVVARHGPDRIRLRVDSSTAMVNGEQVTFDSPATIAEGRVMVPLRFLSEALHATVEWVGETRTVEIRTTDHVVPMPTEDRTRTVILEAGTVIPFSLDGRLSSNRSRPGDRFKASLDTRGSREYLGMDSDVTLEGHVDFVRPRNRNSPGVLSLAFDRLRMPGGQLYQVRGYLIGLDSESVSEDNGRLYARPNRRNDNLRYVGYGAGGGALVAIVTKGNVLNDSLIGAALGFVVGESRRNSDRFYDVVHNPGTKFGLRLTRDLTVRVRERN